VTDETEFEALKELDNWPFRKDATLGNMQLPVTKFTAEALEQVLLEHANITIAALSGVGLDEILYLEAYDAYYNYTSDFAAGVFQCIRGEAEGSTIRLYSAYVDGVGTILTLREQDGKYLIISHQKTK